MRLQLTGRSGLSTKLLRRRGRVPNRSGLYAGFGVL
jgi:hypothetical protein